MKYLQKLLFTSITSITLANAYNPKYDLKLAKEYYNSHQINMAITYFNKVLKHDPHNVTANLYLGKIYLSIDKKLAQLYFAQIKKPNKNTFKKIIDNLNLNKILNNNYSFTSNYFQKYLKVSPTKSTKYSPKEDIKQAELYLNQNKLNLAIAYFEKVLIYQPHNKTANLYLYKIFSNIDKNLSNYYLRNIKKPIKYYNIKTVIGTNYDTNINNDSDATKWDVYVNGEKKVIKHKSNKDDAFSIYEFLKINPSSTIFNTQIINNFSLYNKNVINYHSKNIQLLSYTPTIKTNNKNYYFKYLYIRYSNESYLNKFKLGETLYNKIYNNKLTNKFILTYNNYLADGKVSKDYLDYRIDSFISHKYTNSIVLNAMLSGELAKKIGGNQADEFKKWQTYGNINYKINSYTFGTKIAYSYKRYEKTNTIFNKKQTDQKTIYQIMMKKRIQSFKHNFSIQTILKYVNNNSSINAYSYNKFQISLDIIKKFKVLKE